MQENYFRTDEQVHVISQWWGHRSRSNEEREKNKHTSVMYNANILVSLDDPYFYIFHFNMWACVLRFIL